MSENNILVYKFDELDRCSNKMGQVVQALENLKSMSENVKNGVGEHWHGEAYEAFSSRFADVNQAIDKLYQQISLNKQKLDKAIALERQNEEDINTNTVGRLSTDNIF